jgi:hypothetical protein
MVELAGRSEMDDQTQLFVDKDVVDDKAPPETEIDIMMDNIRLIISDYNGFFIVLKDSQKSFYFSLLSSSTKQAIIDKIENHASKFLGKVIKIEGLTNQFKLNLRMPQAEFSSQFSFYEVLRLTEFGDLLRMKLAVNDRYIYEIVNDIVINQISSERVIRISINRVRVRRVELYFSSGDIVRYAMHSNREGSFISQIHGIIQQQPSDSKTRFFMNSLIFTGKMNVKSSIIWGIDQVPSFREAYEKENFETFIKEQREDSFLNYQFISGFSGFTLRNFFGRFESILNTSTKLSPAFELRTEFEDSLIQFLQTPATQTIVLKPPILSQATIQASPPGNWSDEDWYSKLPPEEKGKSASMMRLIHQSRKLFRDRLKEVLNDRCFGEKIESEILIDRMWAFLANMMQSGNIMKEVSFSLNNVDKSESEVYVKLFHTAIRILLQGKIIRKCSDNLAQRRQIFEPVYRLFRTRDESEIRGSQQKFFDRKKRKVRFLRIN